VKPAWADFSPEVAEALERGAPVVAMESSVWAQGLPRPLNLEVARETVAAVRDAGAVPAIVVVREGLIRYGLDDGELEALCNARNVIKVGTGDLPRALAKRQLGATTVSATLLAADRAGIPVMATGGLGGVHLNWNIRLDISADMGQLARTRCLTVCSGVKSVLDVPATLEMLETLAIPLALFGTDNFPHFYTAGAPVEIGFRVDTPEEAAQAHRYSLATLERGLLVTQPCPAERALESKVLERWVRDGILRAEADGHTGKGLTPFLLDFLARASGGATLEANRALLVANAALAARIAHAMTLMDARRG